MLLTGGGAAVATAFAGTSRSARAQASQSVDSPSISLTAARTLVDAGIAKAQEIGVPMTLVVVDESGILKAYARMDGNSLASVDIVPEKAYTAAAFRTPTHILAERSQSDPARLASLTSLPRVTLLGGGFPITQNGVVIGGIGAGGGTPQQDIEVAQAALAALG
jgi:uncharacterized protein GlcG (DUF336 family)